MHSLTDVKIIFSRHTPLNLELISGNAVPFRITVLWLVSILFTTSDKNHHTFKNK